MDGGFTLISKVPIKSHIFVSLIDRAPIVSLYQPVLNFRNGIKEGDMMYDNPIKIEQFFGKKGYDNSRCMK